jgi:DNA-directed RNA polymerase specialized sigma24 family protein
MTQHHVLEDFDSAWPDIEARLRRVLKGKSVAPWLCDDIVQETGLRLLSKWEDIDPERGPMPLAVTIANNLLWDETHRHQARVIVGHVPDRPDSADVARSGMARLELGRVTRALSRLSTNYRAVLLAEIGHDASLEGAPKAINMLRMRARQRLVALLDKGASSLAGVPVAFKSAVVRLTNLARRNPSSGDALGAAAAILTTVVAVSVLGSGEAGRPQRQAPDLSLPAATTLAASEGGTFHVENGLLEPRSSAPRVRRSRKPRRRRKMRVTPTRRSARETRPG